MYSSQEINPDIPAAQLLFQTLYWPSYPGSQWEGKLKLKY